MNDVVVAVGIIGMNFKWTFDGDFYQQLTFVSGSTSKSKLLSYEVLVVNAIFKRGTAALLKS